jgi:uncharacterized protein YacL
MTVAVTAILCAALGLIIGLRYKVYAVILASAVIAVGLPSLGYAVWEAFVAICGAQVGYLLGSFVLVVGLRRTSAIPARSARSKNNHRLAERARLNRHSTHP